MILYNTDVIDSYFERNMVFRKYVMAITVLTPKLILLFDMIQLHYKEQDQKNLAEVAWRCRHKCTTYIHNCIANIADLNQSSLRLAANLYYLYDDVLVASSIQDKIKAWKTAYLIAERQVLKHAPVSISVSDIPFVPTDCCDLSTEDIERELQDYSDEIEAWLDIYYEYDDFNDNDEQHIYDEIISIITDLRFLAGILHSED